MAQGGEGRATLADQGRMLDEQMSDTTREEDNMDKNRTEDDEYEMLEYQEYQMLKYEEFDSQSVINTTEIGDCTTLASG